MKKTISGIAAVVLTSTALPLGVGLATPGSAGAATPTRAAAVSTQDVTWMRSNDQTDLAEITIGAIALKRAALTDTRMMAQVTIHDHTVAVAKLETLAKTLHVTLPGTPSAAQKAQAAQLEIITDSKFDRQYDLDQVNGHLFSVYQTNGELTRGTDTAVKGFAAYYLPVAQKHLRMAFEDLIEILG